MVKTMARRCKFCKTEIKPAAKCEDIIERKGYCSSQCLINRGKEKKAERQKKYERQRFLEAKERLKTRSDYVKDAQRWFNKWVRTRDYGNVCISCQKPPKKKNAGHYRSTGAAPELRFEPLNVHLQCEHCNTHLSSNAIEYRINLVKKIGVDAVEWLEGPHEPKKYTIEELKAIKAEYKEKCKELERASKISEVL